MATDMVAYGIYPDRAAFERALESLRAAGFRNSDISAILPDRDRTSRDLVAEINTKAPEGVTAGATTGAAIGGVLGWLVGIGAIAIGPRIAGAEVHEIRFGVVRTTVPHRRAAGLPRVTGP